MKALLEQAALWDLIDVATSSDDASETKPAPDILSAALRKADVTTQQAVMIGDTPYDCEAAQRIGLVAIGLECGGWSREDLGCEAVFADPADLLANYENSPLRRVDSVED